MAPDCEVRCGILKEDADRTYLLAISLVVARATLTVLAADNQGIDT